MVHLHQTESCPLRIINSLFFQQHLKDLVEAEISYLDPHSNLTKPKSETDSRENGDLDVPTSGVNMGRYINATHHQDCLTSTMYKAIAPADCGIQIETPGIGKLPCAVMLKVTHPGTMQAPHDAVRECRLLRIAKSVHVLELFEAFQMAGGKLIIVTPFMKYDLEQRFEDGPLSLDEQRSFISNMLEGLAFIHEKGIIHRDIKPSNLILRSRSGPVFIADFGIAWAAYDLACEPANAKILEVSTTCYRPLEILFGDQAYDESLDMWAAGCVSAQIVSLTRRTLFTAGALGSELALIKSIFETLGTPDKETWPVSKLWFLRILTELTT